MPRFGSSSVFFLTLLFLALAISECRLFSTENSDLISDGASSSSSWSSLLVLKGKSATSETCEQTYGFLPCTSTVLGNLFLVIVYGYLMFLGATYLSTGSELLLEVLGPGIVGGLFLPILGALPDAILILVSGLSGSTETAQKQVLIGMGLLSGSTVMLLTLLWGSCIVLGKCDLSERSTAIDQQDTKRFSLIGSGITTDRSTSMAARIMVLSIIPFIIVQLPTILHSTSWKRVAILVSLVVAVLLLISYCLYQVFEPWIQKRRFAYAKHKHIISGILKSLQKHALGRLFDADGQPNIAAIHKLFHVIDQDKNGKISCSELQAFIIGIQLENINLDEEVDVANVMADFDISYDSNIDLPEFVRGITKWLYEAKNVVDHPGHYSSKFTSDFHLKTKEELDRLDNESDEIVEGIENARTVCLKAVFLLLCGTVIAAVFADPLVDAVSNFSTATSIPSFFISFIAMPLATNSSEAVSALIFASRKKQRTASLTFSEIYGAVTMNNILCLAVFLALVYVRHLTWDFSAEVLVILVVVLIMGLVGSFRTTFPLWACFIAYALYPLSLLLVYLLDYQFGWS
ncbi:uncharacterized protein LOC18442228 [Amborella trichopoda]|uniref:EF-hand domain-containing protein n=1 Tax=Amborella trichopoda TaxID=13333 RepID=W1Q104_AMBTC|nr:uncharacterized protein LOC18442228 [Amborella trichopoda]ERN13980.1 hypothetical protein AMTR_s00021p00164610 [Amborella trichopoda]|eukprot:XP_006852513.1 uncharacterized protein LOC18442228 [Amborella trichopoda]